MFDLSKCPRDVDGNYLAQTRDGRPVKLITTRGREPWTNVGYIVNDVTPNVWRANGFYHLGDIPYELDLINIPEPKRSGEVWVNFFIETNGNVNATNAEWTHSEKIARVLVPWAEGEGLEGK